MIQNKINNLFSIAIFLLCNKMLSDHKNVKMTLEIKFQDKTKFKRCIKMIVEGTIIIKERGSILELVQCNMGIFQTSCK